MSCELSVIVPVFNERDNLVPLLASLSKVLSSSGVDYEIIFVDDGSSDGSGEYLAEVTLSDPKVRLVQFRRNFGQTAALAAGIEFAAGSILVTIDADLQNDPADIPALLSRLREGYDVVSCWRRGRRDSWLTRVLPSKLANFLISRISGLHLHDYGCTLKAYRSDVLAHMRLYGEMHRFIPIYASWAGAKVTELQVQHHPRIHGTSKYGLSRMHKVVLDLITVKMLSSYSTKPMYMFGGTGLAACAAGIFFAGWTLFDKFVNDIKAHRNPLLLLAVFLFILGIQFILMGLIAELIIRVYFESRNKTPYLIRRTWNLGQESSSFSDKAGKSAG